MRALQFPRCNSKAARDMKSYILFLCRVTVGYLESEEKGYDDFHVSLWVFSLRTDSLQLTRSRANDDRASHAVCLLPAGECASDPRTPRI